MVSHHTRGTKFAIAQLWMGVQIATPSDDLRLQRLRGSIDLGRQ
jgi:hypothetical protein